MGLVYLWLQFTRMGGQRKTVWGHNGWKPLKFDGKYRPIDQRSSANCKYKKDEENLSKTYHIKLLKTSDEKKIFKQPEKKHTSWTGEPCYGWQRFLRHNAKRQWNNFKVAKEKNLSTWTLYLVKISLRKEGEIKTCMTFVMPDFLLTRRIYWFFVDNPVCPLGNVLFFLFRWCFCISVFVFFL